MDNIDAKHVSWLYLMHAQNGLWGAPPNWSRELVTHTCPPGYCDCSQGFDNEENVGCLLNYTNPDEICTDTRTGIAMSDVRVS